MNLTEYSIDQLQGEIDRRKAEALDQHRRDQKALRQIVLESLRDPAYATAVRRTLEVSNKGSDVCLFEGNGAHKFDIAITLIYKEENE